MAIQSKLPPPLKKQESGKPIPKTDSFSKLLEKKQKKILDKKEAKNTQENPIWAPNLTLSCEEKKPALSTILSTKISEVELKTATPTTTIPIEIEELWGKLASTTILMNSSQDKETTFILETNTSLFSGMRVTIKEFQTAPKVFNIELAPSSSSALSLIAAHSQQLLDRFNRASFDFSIHRIDTELQPHETTDHQKQEADEDS